MKENREPLQALVLLPGYLLGRSQADSWTPLDSDLEPESQASTFGEGYYVGSTSLLSPEIVLSVRFRGRPPQ